MTSSKTQTAEHQAGSENQNPMEVIASKEEKTLFAWEAIERPYLFKIWF